MPRRERAFSEERIYREIKNAILTHALPPNSRLVELKLAEEFGVSRTPIRNAIKRLSYEGLVTIVPNSGAFVSLPSAKEIEDIFQIRLELEGLAARLAARNITEEELERLCSLRKDEEKACAAWDLQAYMDANDSFHLLVAVASRNELLPSVLSRLLARSNVCLIFCDDFYGVPVEKMRSLKEHDRVIEALRSRSPEESKEALRSHLKSSAEHLNLNYLRMREASRRWPRLPDSARREGYSALSQPANSPDKEVM